MLSSAGVATGCSSFDILGLTGKGCADLGRFPIAWGLFAPDSIKFESCLFKSGNP